MGLSREGKRTVEGHCPRGLWLRWLLSWDYLILQVDLSNSQPVLSELEETIQEGFDSFLKVGLCFAEVRFHKLHRATHERFEDYCRERWGLSASRTNQIINTVKVVENITEAVPQ